MTIENIKRKFANIEVEYNDWHKAIEVYERCKSEPLGELPEYIFRAYIVMGTTTAVADALKSAGKRNGSRLFIPNDISETIENTAIADTDIVVVARFLLRNGRDHMDKILRSLSKSKK